MHIIIIIIIIIIIVIIFIAILLVSILTRIPRRRPEILFRFPTEMQSVRYANLTDRSTSYPHTSLIEFKNVRRYTSTL